MEQWCKTDLWENAKSGPMNPLRRKRVKARLCARSANCRTYLQMLQSVRYSCVNCAKCRGIMPLPGRAVSMLTVHFDSAPPAWSQCGFFVLVARGLRCRSVQIFKLPVRPNYTNYCSSAHRLAVYRMVHLDFFLAACC
jgi:hypothetical protein